LGAVQPVLPARLHPGAQFAWPHRAERRGRVAGAEGVRVRQPAAHHELAARPQYE
jgi:hypothetical protein